MFHPNDNQQADFLQKVLPIAQALAEEHGQPFKSRHLNLACGIKPKSKKEAAFRDELLRRIWRSYPNDLYPAMCMEPPAVELRVVE